MQVIINGKPYSIATGATLVQLMRERGIEPAQAVVEVNEEMVPREQIESYVVSDGDVVEILRFVGGG